MTDPIPTGLILAGGLALGAYQLGAIEVLLSDPRLSITAVAGSSIGAMNGAILAGNTPERRLERLRRFWELLATDATASSWTDPAGFADEGTARHWRNRLNILATRTGGDPALFKPRLPGEADRSEVASLYSAEPGAGTLTALIDWGALNDGPVRYVCAATEVRSAEPVLFDTAAGDRITVEHLIASGSLMPSFAPVEIGGRLLGDGGFSLNAPLEPFLASDRRETLPLCILVDLFAPDADRPKGLEQAAERANDLIYAGQTVTRLAGLCRERTLEAMLRPDQPGTDLLHLSYRPSAQANGLEKAWDFSRGTLAERRQAGAADARAAVGRIESLRPEPGLRVHAIRT